VREAKIIEREIEGFSEQSLGKSRGSYRYHSWLRGSQVPVRGVCFAAGSESPRLAQELAVGYLKAGVISFRMAKIGVQEWRAITTPLLDHRLDVSNVVFLLHDLDMTTPGMAEAVADAIDGTEHIHWMATVHDPMLLLPKLRLPFLVYLGLGETGCMRYLAQDEQTMLIDKGSLKRARRC